MSTVIMAEAHYLSTVQGNDDNKTLLLIRRAAPKTGSTKSYCISIENITTLGNCSKKKKCWECKTLQGNENIIGGN